VSTPPQVPSRAPVVLLAGPGASTNAVWHALRSRFGDVPVVLEQPVPAARLLRRRLRTLGPVTVAGQLAFGLLVRPWLRRAGARRIATIVRDAALDERPITGTVVRVPSVNSVEARAALAAFAPAVVVVNGTRIIGRETLRAVDVPFLNVHAGITPAYRGVHGAYWALADRRPELAGSTVHYVDEGIDTGGIVAQSTVAITRDDNFATYPTLQLAAALPALLDAVAAALAGAPPSSRRRDDLPSRLHSHPTAWGYLWRRLRRGVR
jgi:folate-dependent phosphoribosylglycinamide formyltransferase PurN